MSRLRVCIFLLIVTTVAAVAAWSQVVSATLLGTVTDASGAVVPNAKVTITETETAVSHVTQTNESGNYLVPNLPPGVYSVTVEASGFKKEARNAINVLVDTSTRVDLQLTPGNVTETVEVSAAAPTLQTDTASTSEKIDRTVLADSPLISSNRNFQSLLDLAPGVAPVQEQHSQFFNASTSLQTEVNGQMRQGNNFMIEGSDDNERTGLLQIYIPPIEAIQTVDVSLTNHDPELGRASGAIVNVLLKSGTNDYHGAAYEFLQNSDFNARSFFNPSVGHLAYNYVGGNVGGPIRKNKLFFFGDYLRTMDHEANTNLVTIPPNAWRTGDLSGAAQTIYNPFSGNPLDGTGRTPFDGNVIPKSMINTVSAAIMNLLPSTNQTFKLSAPSNNYFALLPFQRTVDSLDTKIDYNITDKDRLSGRFSYSKPVIFQAPLFGTQVGGDGPGGAFMGTGSQKTYVSGLNYDRIVSSTLVTEVRLAVSHYHNEAVPSDYGSNDATNIGIPGVNINPFTSGMVGININDGFSNPVVGYSASLPWIRAEANVDLVNTWTKTKSNHTFKWGFDLKRVRDDLLQDQNYSPRGIFDFNHYQTALCNPVSIGSNGLATSCNPATPVGIANDMASFLLDVPDYIGRDVNTYFPAYRQWEFFAFAGDTWQVSPKLTVNLGVRWEFYPPATPQFPGGFSNYNPDNNTLVMAGIGGNPSNLGMKTHYNYFAPRVGLAYRLTDKTVIRAGFGTSYTPFPDNTYAYNYPVRSNNFYTNVGDGYATTLLSNGQPATFQNGFPAPVPVVVPPNGIIPATGALLSQSFDVINLNFKNPYTETWNLAVQRSLFSHLVLDVAYVGVHGVDTVANVNINNPFSTIGGGTASEPLNILYGKTASATLRWVGYSSSYNSLQVKVERRFSDLTLAGAFTWGKAMNYQTGDDGNLLWLINQRRNYARADFDRTLMWNQSFVYALPWGVGQHWMKNGIAARILGNWQLSGVLSLMTGTPFYVTASGSSLNTPGETQTADQVAPVQILHGINVGNPWFSTSSFQQPTGVRFGTSGRNILSGPGLFALNLSMSKKFKISERFGAELRAETFNFTNTPQFSNPQGSFTNAQFGYVTGTLGSGTGINGTGGGRALQLGARVTF